MYNILRGMPWKERAIVARGKVLAIKYSIEMFRSIQSLIDKEKAAEEVIKEEDVDYDRVEEEHIPKMELHNPEIAVKEEEDTKRSEILPWDLNLYFLVFK
jgi:hypothetical protein